MRSRPLNIALVVTTAVLMVTTAVAVRAQPALPGELERAGERLQTITEEYNEARLRRSRLDEELSGAEAAVEQTETHLHDTRGQLAQAVRDLYMHPTAGLTTLFAARDVRELQRATALAGYVALSADGLLLQIRKARADAHAAAATRKALRDQARREELEIQRRRLEAADAFERAQTALANADLSELEAARRARLESAGTLAAENIAFSGPVRESAMTAVRAAASQMGKPYQWGAEGPDSYDCSGLTMYAWGAAGVSLPHSSRAQYASLPHVPLSELAPGDLVFSGNPIHHVAIYEGAGVVIHSPQTGETVREESVWALNPVGAARP